MEPAYEDSALMLRYCQGDTAAFETLYRRHNDALYRYLLRLCRDPQAAEDVFQDAWGKIVKARETYRPTAGFRTFLFRVAHNCFIDYCRRNQRHQGGYALDPDTRQTDDPGPESQTEHFLVRRRLEAALLNLPDEQRDAWLLHEEGSFSIAEIAAVTGVKPETAKSRLRYAVAKLHAALSPEHPDELAGPGAGVGGEPRTGNVHSETLERR
jgi:RNA polymerase sigma-70 factor (ECF subfamily)